MRTLIQIVPLLAVALTLSAVAQTEDQLAYRLQMRQQAVVTAQAGDREDQKDALRKEEATQRYTHTVSKAAVVVLADVYCDDKLVYVTPREVWKDSGKPVTERITFPRRKDDGFNPDLKPCAAVVWFSPRSKIESWGVSFSDGVHVAGVDGATINGLREYFKKAPNPEPAQSTAH